MGDELDDDLLERLPTTDEVSDRIVKNTRERLLLQRLMKLARQREKVAESATKIKGKRKGAAE